MHRKTLLALGLVSLAVVAVACAPNATQSSLEPAGEEARKAYNLFVPVFWVAVGIFVLVEGALVLFAFRYRHRKGREGIPPQIHGNTRLEIAWTILPAVILAGVAVPTVTTIFDLARDPGPGALDVTVLAHQWWWEFDYPEQRINTANELHIPTGRPVYLTMCAVGLGYAQQRSPSECQPGRPEGAEPAFVGDAVIHSFWPPELAGTQDVIPGRVSTMVLEADEPGVYEGQCKEYCGLSHTYMRFTVVAHTPRDFERWVRDHQAPPRPFEPGGAAAEGARVFFETGCTVCHTVDGLLDQRGEPVPGNNSGPNLSHFASRDCFAGCIFDVTDENLREWLDDPPARKPGSWMPDYGLTEEQIDQLIAFLNALD